MSTQECALIVHIHAEAKGHAPVWRTTPTGFSAKCTNPQCRIVITVDDDGNEHLTEQSEFPTCPLNTSK